MNFLNKNDERHEPYAFIALTCCYFTGDSLLQGLDTGKMGGICGILIQLVLSVLLLFSFWNERSSGNTRSFYFKKT
jgi:hypothetical protein